MTSLDLKGIRRKYLKLKVTTKVPQAAARLRDCSHAIDRGASLPEVQATLVGNVATTSAYLHARPDTSSGLRLDPGVFLG